MQQVLRSTRQAALALLAATSLAAQAPPPQQAAPRPQPIMELPALLALFLHPANADASDVLAWEAGSGPESRIRWMSQGVQPAADHFEREGYPYERAGLVAISVDGKSVYTAIVRDRQVPGAWRVTLLGPRAGATRIDFLTLADAADFLTDAAKVLTAAGWKVTPHKCSIETSPASFGSVAWGIAAPGKRPAWLVYTWNSGASSKSVSYSLLHQKAAADRTECVTG